MKTSFRLLLNSLLCMALATAGSGAQAEARPELSARLVAAGVHADQAEARVAGPFILIGGGAVAAIKAGNRSAS